MNARSEVLVAVNTKKNNLHKEKITNN